MPKELTAEEMEKAEKMPLSELLALAQQPDEEKKPEEKTEKPRDDKGRFLSQGDVLDNSDEAEEEKEEEEGEQEPEKEVFRKVIQNEDGSTDTYEADTLEALVDKIAEGKRNANKKIKELISERRTEDTRTEQQKKDEAYVLQERFKKDPLSVIDERIQEREAKQAEVRQRSLDIQSRFVNTHPDYVTSETNGNRLVAEFRRLYPQANEFTSEGLEKAYLSLKTDGLIQLKPEASGTTEEERTEAAPTEQARTEPTQPRSPKGSTISTRRGSQPKPPKPSFNDDEAYNLPLDELRRRAEAQLAGSQRSE